MTQIWASLSYSNRKHVGALIVKDGMIISDGYNGTPTNWDNNCEDKEGKTFWYVLHAEANAILKIAQSANNASGATLYLTYSPCRDCSKLIYQAGIKRLVYNEAYEDKTGINFLKRAGIEILQIKDINGK